MESESLPIALACRLDKSNALDLTGKIMEYLMENNVKVVLENRIAQRFHPHLRKNLRDMDENSVKMVISVGGDGTILRICKNLPRKYPAPILGVNLGSVGFLDEADADPDILYSALDKIIEGDYITDKVMRLSTYFKRRRLPDALNEVHIVSSKPSKVLHIGVKVDDQLVNTTYADGVLVCTSVGSTAYCISAGGSLVDPRLRVMQIVPINPFAASGAIKPIVVPGSSKVEIELLRPKLNAYIIIDGQSRYKAHPKSTVVVRRSASNIKFIRLDKSIPKSFYSKLRTKILRGPSLPKEDSPEE